MRTIITTAAVIAPIALAAALVLGLNDTATAATTIDSASFTGAPWILGAGLVGLLGLNRAITN